MAYQVLADDGSEMDAHFDLEENALIFHSRGGTKGKNARNVDYSRALRLLIERLIAAGTPAVRAWVDSSQVQDIPISSRLILDLSDLGQPPDRQVALMASRMQAVGRSPKVTSVHGNSTKRIRLELATKVPSKELLKTLKAVPSKKDFRSLERLPTSQLSKVTPEHIWNAIQRLLSGTVDHDFGDSSDYDLILEDGTRLPPKAVFGIAASEALGIPVQPKHFSGGKNTPCFSALTSAGYQIVPKGEPSEVEPEPEPAKSDQEWAEGTPRLRKHLKRERAAGLREAKKAEFRRTHEGQLFCEHCREDPVKKYGSEHGEACIEVHHKKVLVAEMQDGHTTRLEDLQCLCANCHRLEHRLLRLGLT